MTSDQLLNVRNLTKIFQGGRGVATTVLDGIDLDVRAGETVALVGESGSGKTTAGRCISQLTKATSGSIRFRGTEISGIGGSQLREMRRHVQVMFQDSAGALDSRMTILQSVTEPLHIHGIGPRTGREQIARDMLERVGLVGDLVDRKPFGLSGGQLQRAAAARAVVTTPDLVILDEPVSALDVSVRAQVLNLLKGLQRDLGLSYVFIVHDLAIAEFFSDRIYVMYRGRIVESGPADRFCADARHPYTRALLSAVLSPDPRLAQSHELETTARAVTTNDGCAFAPRCPLRGDHAACVGQVPELGEVATDHAVACHVVREDPGDRAGARANCTSTNSPITLAK